MTIQTPITPGGREQRPVLRIAIPSWRAVRTTQEPLPEPKRPSREEFKRLLDTALDQRGFTQLRLSKAERRQRAIMRQVREALYGSPVRG